MSNHSNVDTGSQSTPKSIRFLREPEVLARVGVSTITLVRWEMEGLFPKRRKIGKHAVAWVDAEVDEWCANRAAGIPLDGRAA